MRELHRLVKLGERGIEADPAAQLLHDLFREVRQRQIKGRQVAVVIGGDWNMTEHKIDSSSVDHFASSQATRAKFQQILVKHGLHEAHQPKWCTQGADSLSDPRSVAASQCRFLLCQLL